MFFRSYFDLPKQSAPLLKGSSAFLFVFLFLAGELLLPAIFVVLLDELPRQWGEVAGITMVWLLLLMAALFHLRAPIAQLMRGGKRYSLLRLKQDFGFALLALLLAYPFVILVNAAGQTIVYHLLDLQEFEQVAVREVRAALEEPLLRLSMYAMIVILVPCIEEFIFRGVLLTWLRRYFSSWSAILFSSLLFSAAHLAPEQGATNFVLFPSLMVLSIFMGHLYLKRESLLATILMHALFNAVNVALLDS